LATGETIPLDSQLDECIGSAILREKLEAENPAAAAKFFHLWVESFLTAILGWDKAKSRPVLHKNHIGGVFGPVEAYFGCVEEQGRKRLHLHLVAWLMGVPLPGEIESLIQTKHFKDQLCKFLDANVLRGMPKPWAPQTAPTHSDDAMNVSSGDDEEDADADDVEMEFTDHDENDVPHEHVDRGKILRHLTPCPVPGHSHKVHRISRRPPDPDDPNFLDQVIDDVEILALCVNSHRCNPGCFKKKTKPLVCRYGYGPGGRQQLVLKTHLDADGKLVLKRTHATLNNFHDCMLIALRCNVDVKVILSGVHSRSLIFYITAYTSKSQLSIQSRRDLLLACLSKNEARYCEILGDDSPHQHRDAHREKARIMTINCLNKFTSAVELGAALVLTHLLGLPNHYSSHTIAHVMFNQAVSFVEHAYGSLDLYPQNFNIHVTALGRAVYTAQILDYFLRPRVLDMFNLYDFHAEFSVVKGPATKRNGNLAFLNNHPLAKTHSLKKNATRKVPLLYGPQIPRKNKKNQERFAKLAITLLTPWPRGQQPHREDHLRYAGMDSLDDEDDPVVTVNVLVQHDRVFLDILLPEATPLLGHPLHSPEFRRVLDDGNFETWSAALERHMSPGGSLTKAGPKKYLTNVEDVNRGVELKRQEINDRVNGSYDPGASGEGPHVSDCYYVDDEEFADFINEQQHTLAVDTRIESNGTRLQNHFQRVVESVARHNLYPIIHDPRLPGNNADNPSPAYSTATDEDIIEQKAWAVSLKGQAKKAFCADMDSRQQLPPTDNKPVWSGPTHYISDETDLTTVMKAHYAKHSDLLPDNVTPLSLEECASKHTLNTSQRLALLIVALQVCKFHINSALTEDRRKKLQPLKFYLGGQAGSGKSRVLLAVQDFFQSYGLTVLFRITAKTARAAASVSGSTLDKARQKTYSNTNRPEKSKPTSSKWRRLNKIWENVDFLFNDEVSLCSKRDIAYFSHAICYGKNLRSSQNMGGVNVIWCGDFAQLPPPTAPALYEHPNPLSDKPSKQAKTLHGLDLIGYGIWDSVDTVVNLHKNHRVKDKRFQAFLHRLRFGACTQKDADWLNRRALCNVKLTPALRAELRHAKGITPRHTVRELLSNNYLLSLAAAKGVRPLVILARDTRKDKPITQQARNKFLALPASSVTQYLPGMLLFVPGARCTLKQNICTEKGLFNTATGTMAHIKLNRDEPAFDPNPALGPHFLKHMPVSLTLMIDGATHEKPDGTPAQTEEGPATLVLGTTSHAMDIKGIKLRRRQFPVIPGTWLTDYGCQGETFKHAFLLDLEPIPGRRTKELGTSAYVMISRATTIENVYLIRPVALQDLQRPPPPALLAELDRLDAIEQNTRAAYAQLFRTCYPNYTPPPDDPYWAKPAPRPKVNR
jgi:hypothetical protein